MKPVRSMPHCPDTSQLMALLQGDLDDCVRPLLEDHVETCSSCCELLRSLSADSLVSPLVGNSPRRLSADGVSDFLRDLARQIPEPLRSPPPDSRGKTSRSVPEIPGFHQLEWIGRGGSGEVYRAWQPALARWVAIKTLPAGRSPEQAERVLREAQILGRLNHRHIVQIHGAGAHAGRPYLVMEWMAGGSLQQRVAQRGLSIREVVRVGHQLAQALEAVHVLGIIHRDLKPANVLLDCDEDQSATTSDSGPLAKLTDFNIALDPESDDRLTRTGEVVGTPHFMAPEQTGLAPDLGGVGPATDVYGLGAVLYVALTGQAPHDAQGHLAVLQAVVSGEPRSPRRLRPEIPPDLETIVVKCLRHDPQHRYRSAGELADDLRRYLEGRPIAARPYSLREKLWCWGRQRRVWGTPAAVGLFLAGLSVAGGVYHHIQTRQLHTELWERQRQVHETNTQVLDERRISRRAKWETLKQLTAKAEAMLQSGTAVPDQRRGLLETVRGHYRNRIDDLDESDPATAMELADGLERLTGLEEREGLLTQALADLDLLDQIAGQFSPGLPLDNHHVWRELRRARVLIQLQRLPDAADHIDALFARNARHPFGQNLLAALRGVTHLGRAAMAQGDPALVLPHLDQALSVVQGHLEEQPDDFAIGRGRFELLSQKLQVLDQTPDPSASEAVEQEWLRFARQFASRPAPLQMSQRIARLQLMQRIGELGLARSSAVAQEILPLWIREIAAFRDGGTDLAATAPGDFQDTPQGKHEAELVVQQVDCLAKSARLGPTDPQAVDKLPGWPEALRQARLYLDRNPGDQTTRFRISWSLVDYGRRELPHDARRSLEVAQEACHLLSPVSGSASPDAEGRQLLSDALYLSASSRRSLGQLTECCQDLERAYLISQGGNRDTIAADLVVVRLALGDRVGAEKAAGWILTESPQLREARRLLGELSTAQVSP